MIVRCTYCGQKLETDASSIGMVAECPNCGRDFTITSAKASVRAVSKNRHSQMPKLSDGGTITIQKTGKGIKLFLALSKMAILVGLGLFFAGILMSGKDGISVSTIGIFSALIGFVVYIFARIMKWWNHE